MTRPSVSVASCSLAIVAIVTACPLDSAGSGFPIGASVAEGPSPTTGGSEEDAGDDDAESTDDAPRDESTSEAPQGGGSDDGAQGGETTRGTDAGGDDSLPPNEPADDAADSAADTTPSDTAESGSDAGADVCPAEVATLYWMSDAVVTPPMALVPTDAADDPEVAISEVAESGEVVVTIEIPCEGEYAIWGLVWDLDPGAWANPDPDSLWVDVGGGETLWRYGCQTDDAVSGLSWQQLSALAAQPCDLANLVVQAPGPGSYEIRFRNREAGDGSAVAGIAAIAVLSDLDADPSALYEPY